MSEEIVPHSSVMTNTIHVLPEITLDTTDMPEVADYDVGDTYDAIIHCEMVSKHKGLPGLYGESENPSVTRGRFKIISIKPTSTNGNANDKMKAINRRANNY